MELVVNQESFKCLECEQTKLDSERQWNGGLLGIAFFFALGSLSLITWIATGPHYSNNFESKIVKQKTLKCSPDGLPGKENLR